MDNTCPWLWGHLSRTQACLSQITYSKCPTVSCPVGPAVTSHMSVHWRGSNRWKRNAHWLDWTIGDGGHYYNGWDEQMKLVNLTTRLKGQAYTFYKSCSEQQRENYTALVGKLTKRFTLVHLQAVQSGFFCDGRHHPKESVCSGPASPFPFSLPTRTAREYRSQWVGHTVLT